jgi:glycosyltransferase involved in cell wall biosynthesis
MRVLHIVTAFPRCEGDVITPWLAEMLRGLKGRGIDVEVFTSSHKGLGGQILWGIPVHRFRYFPSRWENLTHEEMAVDRMGRSPLYKLLPAFYLISGSLAAWRLCRKTKYDVVHVHWPLPHALFGWIAGKACGAGLVTTFYGAEVRWAKHSRLPFLKGFLAWAARVSDRVIAISTYTAGEVGTIVDAPVEVIPYTIGFSDESKREKKDVRREPFDCLGTARHKCAQGKKSEVGKKMVLTVGRLVERKGIRYLIDAMRLLPVSLNAELVVVGGGPLKGELEEQARAHGLGDRVKFAGKVSEQELIDYYRNAAVYVQPAIVDSRGDTEMLGVVLLEAMHYGVPVVASKVGGITDVVRDGETGLLVPGKDPNELALGIQRLLNDVQLRHKVTVNAKKSLATNYKWDKILQKIVNVYSNL